MKLLNFMKDHYPFSNGLNMLNQLMNPQFHRKTYQFRSTLIPKPHKMDQE